MNNAHVLGLANPLAEFAAGGVQGVFGKLGGIDPFQAPFDGAGVGARNPLGRVAIERNAKPSYAVLQGGEKWTK